MRKLWRDITGQELVESALVNLFVTLGALAVLAILAAALAAALASLGAPMDGYVGSKPVSSGPHVPMAPSR
jgi:hypothetical protein